MYLKWNFNNVFLYLAILFFDQQITIIAAALRLNDWAINNLFLIEEGWQDLNLKLVFNSYAHTCPLLRSARYSGHDLITGQMAAFMWWNMISMSWIADKYFWYSVHGLNNSFLNTDYQEYLLFGGLGWYA